MIRTQIQLPDEVFARAKKVCEAREISMAELARRGIEYILTMHAAPTTAETGWPRKLGWKGLTDAQIKEAAQKSSAELLLRCARSPCCPSTPATTKTRCRTWTGEAKKTGAKYRTPSTLMASPSIQLF